MLSTKSTTPVDSTTNATQPVLNEATATTCASPTTATSSVPAAASDLKQQQLMGVDKIATIKSFGIGGAMGVFGGMLGLGGGVLAIPLLVACGVSQHRASATSAVAITATGMCMHCHATVCQIILIAITIAITIQVMINNMAIVGT
jgi:hypothetical protein